MRLLPGPLPVSPALLGPGTVLAFDAALANTGWSVVRHRTGHAPEVLACGVVRTTSDLRSHEKTFARAVQLKQRLRPITTEWLPRADHVVCERPAIAGHRIESALMAAMMVYELCGDRVHLVSRQHALRLFCGPGRQLPKSASNAAAKAWLPPAPDTPFNEHIADSELIALTWLYDLVHGGTP